ncbi:hypothetical protein CCP1ISM_110022 [Azospirillaceae bacterium]
MSKLEPRITVPTLDRFGVKYTIDGQEYRVEWGGVIPDDHLEKMDPLSRKRATLHLRRDVKWRQVVGNIVYLFDPDEVLRPEPTCDHPDCQPVLVLDGRERGRRPVRLLWVMLAEPPIEATAGRLHTPVSVRDILYTAARNELIQWYQGNVGLEWNGSVLELQYVSQSFKISIPQIGTVLFNPHCGMIWPDGRDIEERVSVTRVGKSRRSNSPQTYRDMFEKEIKKLHWPKPKGGWVWSVDLNSKDDEEVEDD